MNIQWHPGSGKRTVAVWELSPRRQTLAAVLLSLLALVLGAAPLVFSTVLSRWRRRAAEMEVAALNSRRKEALELATSALRQTFIRLGSDRDLIGRVAFLYELPGLARTSLTFSADADGRLEAAEQVLDFLRRLLRALEETEKNHPDWPGLTPSLSPVPESTFVPTGSFGWSTSRLTGQSEFAAGLDLACPAGQPVRSPADGVVRWSGPFPLRPGYSYGHLGRIVAVRHGDRAVTIFGYLASTRVRRGQTIRRGDLLGSVGIDPWLSAPRLRFEVWRLTPSGAAPIDPRVTMLDVSSPEVAGALRQALRGSPRSGPELPAEFR
jgi:murein DD-endopeptidase MepM/ murein hydrolase activator NlpD